MADEEPIEAATDAQRRLPRWVVPGFVAGPAGVALSWLLLPDFFVNPVLFVAVTAPIAWGFIAALFVVQRRIDSPFGDPLIVALVPYLAWPFLARLLADVHGLTLPPALALGSILEFLVLGLGYAIYAGLALSRWSRGGTRRLPALASGTVGAAGVVLLLGNIIHASPTLTSGGLLIFLITMTVVSMALLIQWGVVRTGLLAGAAWMATGPALAVAGTQLFDGVVTYLSVIDPLGIAPRRFEEEILLSRIILESTGVGFSILKWVLAIVIAYALDGRRDHALPAGSLGRLVFYLVLVVIGMGPSLYSGTQVL